MVVGNSPVERYWTSELRRAFQQFTDRVNITWFNDLTFVEMQERAASMSPSSVIFWFLLSEDAAGVPYSEDRALDTMREISAVPIFGMGDYQMGRGVVGGPLMQTKVLGQQGAVAALRILKGEKPRRSIHLQSCLDSPSMTVENCSGGGLAKPGYLLTVSCIFVSRHSGNSIAGRSRPSLRSFHCSRYLSSTFSFRLPPPKGRGRGCKQRQEVAHLMRVSVLGELSCSIAHEINQPLTAILSNAQAALHLLAQKSPNLRGDLGGAEGHRRRRQSRGRGH